MPPYDPGTKTIDLAAFDFSCSAGARVFDLDSKHDSTVNQYFVSYSTSLNKEFISKAFDFYKGWGLDIELRNEDQEYLAKYPGDFPCAPDK